jgi:hypothetical protein
LFIAFAPVRDNELPLNEDLPRAITFILADRGRQTPVGTAFIAGYEEDGYTHRYLVTAKHCIQAEQQTWVRVLADNNELGEPIRIRKWIEDPRQDLAVAPFALRSGGWRQIPLGFTVLRPAEQPPRLGDRVYFPGLLSVPSMADRNVPFVRSGTLGAIGQRDIRATYHYPDGRELTLVHDNIHLIDAVSFEGFRGAPCMIQSDQWRRVQGLVNGQPVDGIAHGENTLLLGIVVGHFNERDDDESLLNSGIAIVLPVSYLRDLIHNDPTLIDARQQERADST